MARGGGGHVGGVSLPRDFSGNLRALTQAFREAQPVWLAACTAMVLLPLCSHSIEFAIHFFRGTPKLAASIVSSVIFTALSTLFNLYAMRRNILIVGSGAGTLASDFRAVPRVLGGFLAVLPLAVWRLIRKPPQQSAHVTESTIP